MGGGWYWKLHDSYLRSPQIDVGEQPRATSRWLLHTLIYTVVYYALYCHVRLNLFARAWAVRCT